MLKPMFNNTIQQQPGYQMLGQLVLNAAKGTKTLYADLGYSPKNGSDDIVVLSLCFGTADEDIILGLMTRTKYGWEVESDSEQIALVANLFFEHIDSPNRIPRTTH